MPREQTLDGDFELIDSAMVESHGMFASADDAATYADTYQIRAFEIWRDEFLIRERKCDEPTSEANADACAA